jgi:signal peptidase II
MLIIVGAYVVDRLVKWWMADFFLTNGPTQVLPWLTLRETYNRGVAFGLFQGVGPVVGWLSVGVLLVALVYLWRTPPELWLERLGLSLFVGGAAGNLWDRITEGAVLDFFQLPIQVGIFNVADILINTGVALVLISFVWELWRHRPGRPSPAPEQGEQREQPGAAPESDTEEQLAADVEDRSGDQ